MKQVLIKKGRVFTEEVQAPVVSDGAVLIKVVASCISAGTELAAVASSGEPLIKKALQQPEKIVKAFNMLKVDGFLKVMEKIKGKFSPAAATG